MGILDKFNSSEAKKTLEDDLKSKVGITGDKSSDEKNSKKENTKKENNPIKRKEETEENVKLDLIKIDKLEEVNQEVLEAFVNEFKDNYKQLEKENRMISLQKKNYKNLIKLKVDKVSMSEFVNFAIHFTLKSSNYNHIIKLLKKPK